MTNLRYGFLIVVGLMLARTGDVQAMYPQCYEVCGPSTSCDEECEDYGTCGNYDGGVENGWCESVCGDDYCDSAYENFLNCNADCNSYCGDDVCNLEGNELCNCSADCGSCESTEECVNDWDCEDGMECLDGVCGDPPCGDCGVDERCCYDFQNGDYCCEFLTGCGDGECSPGIGENVLNCSEDCADVWDCGNHVCGYPSETHYNCSLDCYCGDGLCEQGQEDAYSCSEDC